MASSLWCRFRAQQLMGSTVWGMRRGVARTTRLLQQTPGEKKVASVLQSALTPSKLSVKDISGGCGSMFEIVIEAEGFRGKRTVQQHQMVNDALKEQVKEMHGLVIRTSVPV